MTFAETTIHDDSLKRSLVVSAVLHLLLLLVVIFGLPHFFTPLPTPPHPPVPFQIVELAELTNTRVEQPEPAKPPEPPPPPPTPKPEQVQMQTPQPAETAPEALKPAEKPKPVENKPQQQAFTKLLKNLETSKKTEAPKAEETKPDSKSTAQPMSAAPSLSNRLTISEEDALRRQIAQCWNMPIGARDAQNLVVEVSITVNPDRTVQSAEIVDKGRMLTDSFFRAAAESALRALYNPRCTPLELPDGKYEQWKAIDFTFDPREMAQ
jgi:outer membrane biosynthesis protein TonB